MARAQFLCWVLCAWGALHATAWRATSLCSAAVRGRGVRRSVRTCAVRSDDLISAARDAARAAGALILAASPEQRAVDVEKFNDKDLLTLTDTACQDAIADVLRDRVPTARFLGEEEVAPGASASARAAADAFGGDDDDAICWVVDPIDGTSNFVDSIPLSTVSIAAVRCGADARVVAGVVYDPYRDELFEASEGGGAFLTGPDGERRALRVSRAASLGEAIVYAGAPPNPLSLAPSLRGICAVAPKARTLRLLGSAALMLAYVAAGRGAAYFEADLSAWDTAAGALLITEAGGLVTDASGEPYGPRTRQIVATNSAIHAELLALLGTVGGASLDEV